MFKLHSFRYSDVLRKKNCRGLNLFSYRRRCCRMVMLSGSRRRDESNATASTCSFFFIKLPKALWHESELVKQFTRSCVNHSIIIQEDLKRHKVKKKKNWKKTYYYFLRTHFLKVPGRWTVNVKCLKQVQPECIHDKSRDASTDRKVLWAPV